MSTKLLERETSSDWRSFNDFFSDSASAAQLGRKLLVVELMVFDVQAEMRVGSIPTLDSVSKRYDTVKLLEYLILRPWLDDDEPWTRILATSAHLKDVRAENGTGQRMHTWESLLH